MRAGDEIGADDFPESSSPLWLPNQVALNAEIENLGQSIVSSSPGESGPEATRADGWVSGEEFYTYVQQGWVCL